LVDQEPRAGHPRARAQGVEVTGNPQVVWVSLKETFRVVFRVRFRTGR
jgi:hypothetical protein